MRGALIIGLALLASCALGDRQSIVAPDPLDPCRPNEVFCPTQHGCCLEHETCGGEPASVGCPAGSCCAISTGDFGARLPHPQRRP